MAAQTRMELEHEMDSCLGRLRRAREVEDWAVEAVLTARLDHLVDAWIALAPETADA